MVKGKIVRFVTDASLYPLLHLFARKRQRDGTEMAGAAVQSPDHRYEAIPSRMSMFVSCTALDINFSSKADLRFARAALLSSAFSTYVTSWSVCVSGCLVVWEDYPASGSMGANSSSSSRSYLGRKVRFRHADQMEDRYKCSKCSKTYRWKHHLVEHVKASCGQMKAECCPYCSYKSNRKWNLKSHVKRIHSSVWESNLATKLRYTTQVVTHEIHYWRVHVRVRLK